MNDDSTRRKHIGAVAFVRWQLASERYRAIARAHADEAIDAEELRRAEAEVTSRHSEWMSFLDADRDLKQRGEARAGLH